MVRQAQGTVSRELSTADASESIVTVDEARQVLAELAPQSSRLATDTEYLQLGSNAARLKSGYTLLNSLGASELRQLLLPDLSLLTQLVRVTCAVVESLTACLSSADGVDRLALRAANDGWGAFELVIALYEMVALITTRLRHSTAASTPTDAAVLKILQQTGLIKALTAAAAAGADYLDLHMGCGVQLRHAFDASCSAPARCKSAVLLLVATLTSELLALWCSCAQLAPPFQLMHSSSPFINTVAPIARLALAVARVFAGTAPVRGKLPRVTVSLQVGLFLARAAVAIPDEPGAPDARVLAGEGVLELLLLPLAAGLEQLHAQQKGVSQQVLVKDLRTAGTAASSSSSGSGGGGSRRHSSKPGRVAVAPHHEHLLQAHIGVRQVLHLLGSSTIAQLLLNNMSLILVASMPATTLNSSSGSSSSSPPASWPLPWSLAFPVQLAWVELCALAPPFLANNLGLLSLLLDEMVRLQQLQLYHASPTRCAADVVPPLDPAATGQLAQACLASIWLELGPVMLSLCRRQSGEADPDDGAARAVVHAADGSPLSITPRHAFACFSRLLLDTMQLQVVPPKPLWRQGDPQPTRDTSSALVTIAAVLEAELLLASMVAEAALHAVGELSAALAAGSGSAGSSPVREDCFAAGILADFTAELAAAKAAAGHGPAAAEQQQQQRLLKQLFGQLTAGLKHALHHTPVRSIREDDELVVRTFQNVQMLVLATMQAAHRVLDNADASRMSLYDINVSQPAASRAADALTAASCAGLLARTLVAAAAVLHEAPAYINSSGGFVVSTSAEWHWPKQMRNMGALMRVLVKTVVTLQALLAPVPSGAMSAAASCMPWAGLGSEAQERLREQGEELLEALMKVDAAGFNEGNYAANGS